MTVCVYTFLYVVEKAAGNAADFILTKMRENGTLYHRYRDGEVAIPAFLDDYVFFIWGLLEFYETTFESDYLKNAVILTDELIRHFWDKENGGFYLTSDEAEELLIRKKEIYDGAIPSGNSVAMLNLMRLARITANTEYETKAWGLVKAFSGTVSRSPSAYTMFMQALDFAIGPTAELVIVGDRESGDSIGMLKTLRKEFVPGKVVVFRSSGDEEPEMNLLVPHSQYLLEMDGKATAYVCRNFSCESPTNDKEKMLQLLKAM